MFMTWDILATMMVSLNRLTMRMSGWIRVSFKRRMDLIFRFRRTGRPHYQSLNIYGWDGCGGIGDTGEIAAGFVGCICLGGGY